MRSFSIAVYPGDGIGVEVTAQVVRALKVLEQDVGGFELDLTEYPWGTDYFFEHGCVAPDDYLDVLKKHDAIFLGALGDPTRLPDHVTLVPLIQLRQRFDLYACVRPARLLPGLKCPLAGKKAEDVDLVVLRENSEGEYVDNGGRFRRGEPEEFALQTAVHTRRGVERILRFGFEMARKRRGRLTMITKSNAQKYGYVLWDEVLERVRPDYADVETDKQHVDAASMNFVRWPERFDVVVASNLFGDILSDLSGIIAGGLGMAPSANINPERKFPSVFEPVHGSAPDIAGKGIANPIGALVSAAMMLEWLDLSEAAALLRKGVEDAVASGHATPDIGGDLTTERMTDKVIEMIGRDR